MLSCFDFLKNKLSRRKPFRLAQLPILARNEVIRNMANRERISLAVTSKRMKEIVKCAKIQTDVYIFHVQDNPTMEIKDGNPTHSVGTMTREEKNLYHIVKKWENKETENFKYVLKRFEQLYEIAPGRQMKLYFNLFKLKSYDFFWIINHPAFRNWSGIKIYGGQLSGELLDAVMDQAGEEKSIAVPSFMPEVYSHKNAFIFRNIYYHYCGWVRIEDLLNLRNSQKVVLIGVIFQIHDFNAILKQWINSSHEMFRTLYLATGRYIHFDYRKLFDGISVLGRKNGCGPRRLFIITDPSKERKFQIAEVKFTENDLKMMTFAAEKFPREFEILQIKNHENYLKDELVAMDVQIKSIDINKNYYQVMDLKRKKEEMVKELSITRGKLSSAGVGAAGSVYFFL